MNNFNPENKTSTRQHALLKVVLASLSQHQIMRYMSVQHLTIYILFCLTLGATSTFCQEDETGFYLVFEDTENPDIAQILDFIAEDQELLFDVIEELNDYLEIPAAVPILFTDCGVANAFYTPEHQGIAMCYEMMLESFRIYSAFDMTEEELSLAIANNIFSIMYHEIGHALVDLLELPITGREEDAVDQFSVVSLLEFEELGQEALIHFALFWGGLADQNESQLENMAFYGEHSLSSQRFYDILCLTYGSNTEGLSHFVENGLLPESRAVRCEDEFIRVANAWIDILDPYVKD